ncbi:MAG: aldolase/citrate lyase family protein [Planctomycetes bacterium]|nr:aldolase/citrate lyase family protein [Planctomycetota bacterium]
MAKGASPLQNADCRRPGQDLKTGLRNGKLMIGGMLTEYARPSLAKLYKQAGFDFLYVEYEHGFFNLTTLADTVTSARDNDLPVIAKTPQLERAAVAKLLECGVVGIQLPRTETRSDIETLRDYIKFPPSGTRAIAPGYGSSGYTQPDNWPQWMSEQDEDTTLVVHIETRRAYENAEEIVSTPGVDMVYVGPGDFSIEMGYPGDYDHPVVCGAMEEILKLCNKYRVPFGTTPSNLESAGQWIDRGALFFEAIDEITLIARGAADLVKGYRDFVK